MNPDSTDLTNENNISLDEESMYIFDSPKNYQKKIKNPQINHFNKYSFFVYDNFEAKLYLDSVKNKELIKLNTEEENFLIGYIKIINHEKDIKRGNNLIFIDKNLFLELKNFFVEKNNNSDIEKFL